MNWVVNGLVIFSTAMADDFDDVGMLLRWSLWPRHGSGNCFCAPTDLLLQRKVAVGSISANAPSNTGMTTKNEPLLDHVRVASPCNARWEDMTGDDRARFCKQCSKHVFNLSAMTRPEAESLIREKEGKFCGRYNRRRDGTMLTADCPTGLRRCRERLGFVFGAMVGALMFLFTGCRQPEVVGNPEIMGKIAAPQPLSGMIEISQPAPTSPPPIMGDIAVPVSSPNQK